VRRRENEIRHTVIKKEGALFLARHPSNSEMFSNSAAPAGVRLAPSPGCDRHHRLLFDASLHFWTPQVGP
jgi:hypothetical protein